MWHFNNMAEAWSTNVADGHVCTEEIQFDGNQVADIEYTLSVAVDCKIREIEKNEIWSRSGGLRHRL